MYWNLHYVYNLRIIAASGGFNFIQHLPVIRLRVFVGIYPLTCIKYICQLNEFALFRMVSNCCFLFSQPTETLSQQQYRVQSDLHWLCVSNFTSLKIGWKLIWWTSKIPYDILEIFLITINKPNNLVLTWLHIMSRRALKALWFFQELPIIYIENSTISIIQFLIAYMFSSFSCSLICLSTE